MLFEFYDAGIVGKDTIIGMQKKLWEVSLHAYTELAYFVNSEKPQDLAVVLIECSILGLVL